MTGFRSQRALIAFIAILLAFLLVEAFLISAQQRHVLTMDAEQQAALQIDLMADTSYESLLKADYATIRTFIERWGERHPDYLVVRATAPTGFIIGEYARPVPTGMSTFELTKSVTMNGRELLRLDLVGSYGAAEEIARSLRNRLFAGALLFTVVLGTVLWRTLRSTAIVPLEREIERRHQAERDLQRSHDVLEATVEERTADLRKELAERKRVEQELLRREERIHLLLNSTAEGIYGVDTDGLCTFCNPSALRMLGFSGEADVLGKRTHDLFHHKRPDGLAYPLEECRIYDVYRSGQGCHSDNEVFWRSEGTAMPVEYWSYPIRGGTGGVIGAVVTFIDITDRKRLESQLIQSHKMEAIGTLAGGVAHDFNNILTAVIGYGSMLQRKMIATDPLRANVDNIMEAAQRAARLTQSLLTFSRKQVMSPQPVDINAVVRRVEKLLGRIIGEDVAIVLALCDEDLVVHADSGRLEQVLMNLATNSRDAMPNGGTFILRTERTVLSPEEARLRGVPAHGDYAVLAVSDTGAGMDEATQASVFEPFFTTKDVGRGTGLGMSIAYGIIKQHHGAITVYSEVGKGTTFKIYLPLQRRQAMEPAEAPAPAAMGGDETTLVAEDDRAVLALIKLVLSENGYRIIEAADGDEAVRLFEKNRGSIDLVLLDTIMPKMNGRQAYEAMRAHEPNLRALFMSGYTADVIGKQGLLEPGFDLLQKPMMPADLLIRVRKALTV